MVLPTEVQHLDAKASAVFVRERLLERQRADSLPNTLHLISGHARPTSTQLSQRFELLC